MRLWALKAHLTPERRDFILPTILIIVLNIMKTPNHAPALT